MTGTFEGVGSLQFSPDNKLALAYSGEIGSTNVETTLLEFETNSEYILGEFNFNKNTGDGDDINYQVYINDIIIQGWMHDYSARGFRNIVKILIPPDSKVKTTATNDTSSTSRNICCSFTGKVSGAIEQINLESITDDNKWAEKGPF